MYGGIETNTLDYNAKRDEIISLLCKEPLERRRRCIISTPQSSGRTIALDRHKKTTRTPAPAQCADGPPT
jgi:hypothetical protein